MIESASPSVHNINGAGRGIGNSIFQELLWRGARALGPVRKPTGLSATVVKASPNGLASLAVKALLEEVELTPKPAPASALTWQSCKWWKRAAPIISFTRFLTARPIRDIYGIVETPDTAGLIDPGDAAGVRSVLNERSQGGMP
jgi:hypothetical protein